jgi:hypothetical protein
MCNYSDFAVIANEPNNLNGIVRPKAIRQGLRDLDCNGNGCIVGNCQPIGGVIRDVIRYFAPNRFDYARGMPNCF